MTTLTANAYQLARAIAGHDDALMSRLAKADVLDISNDPQDHRYRYGNSVVCWWVSQQKEKGRKIDAYWQVRPYRFAPQLPDIPAIEQVRDEVGNDKWLKFDWPCWSRDVGVPPYSACAQGLTDPEGSVGFFAASGRFKPWHGPRSFLPYNVSGDDEYGFDYETIWMQVADPRWLSCLSDFYCTFAAFVNENWGWCPGLHLDESKGSSMYSPLSKYSIRPCKGEDPSDPDSKWEYLHYEGDPDDPRGRNGKQVVLDVQPRVREKLVIDKDGRCDPQQEACFPDSWKRGRGGYFLLAEWWANGIYPEQWRAGSGSHFDWCTTPWSDCFNAYYDFPQAIDNRACDMGADCPLLWLEACFVEKPWRLVAKRPDLCNGITLEQVRVTLRQTMEYADRITLPAYTEHDAPAMPIYEYARNEFRGTVEQK